jgi:hypothetical protein
MFTLPSNPAGAADRGMTTGLPGPRRDRLMAITAALAFLWLAVPSGLFLATAVPPGQGLDEGMNAVRAGALAHGRVAGKRQNVAFPSGPVAMAGVDADLALLGVTGALHEGEFPQVSWREVMLARGTVWRGFLSFVPLGVTATVFPLFHIPAAAVIAAAPSLHILPFDAVIDARLAGFAVFAVLSVAALLAAPRGRGILFCILALPTCQALAAAISPEGLTIAAIALAVALLGRRVLDAPPDRWLAAAACLLAAATLVRPALLPLLALLLLPLPVGQGQGRLLAGRALAAALAALPALAWLLWIALRISADLPVPPYSPGPLWPAAPDLLTAAPLTAVGPHTQLPVVRAAGLRLVPVFLQALLDNDWLPRQMVGVLGRMNVLLPGWLCLLWAAAFAAAVLGDLAVPPGAAGRAWSGLAIIVLAGLAAVLATCLWLYLWVTPAGAATVAGMQGILLLAVLPPFALALPALGRDMPGLRAAGLAAPILASAVSLAWLPVAVIDGLYLR